MNTGLSVVTAFFPIKREKFKGFERSNEKYLMYFECWARIWNDLIIYTTPECKMGIEKICKGLRPTRRTKIIVVKDYRKIDEELYTRLCKTMSNPLQKKFKTYSRNPEVWSADYNYVTSLKFWCLDNAFRSGYINTDYVCWLDFGFVNGNEFYKSKNAFDRELVYNGVGKNKIQVFSVADISEDIPIFEITRRLIDVMQTGLIVLPTKKASMLWDTYRNRMSALNSIGLADDDQTIIYMCCQARPDDFNIIKCGWREGIEVVMQGDFGYIPAARRKKKLKIRIMRRAKILTYLANWYGELLK